MKSLPDDPNAGVMFRNTVVTPSNNAWTFQFEVRPLLPGERGKQTWPRITSPNKRDCVVISAIAWPGEPRNFEHAAPRVRWTFDPLTCTHGETYRPVLDLTSIRWSSGAPRIETMPDKLAIAELGEATKNEHPTWAWPRVVNHIGLVRAIQDEGRSGNPEQAALRAMQRWRKVLRKIQ